MSLTSYLLDKSNALFYKYVRNHLLQERRKLSKESQVLSLYFHPLIKCVFKKQMYIDSFQLSFFLHLHVINSSRCLFNNVIKAKISFIYQLELQLYVLRNGHTNLNKKSKHKNVYLVWSLYLSTT